MLRYETGDLVKDNYPVFCYQVNCKKVMGAGIAKQIRSKYPEVYNEYVKETHSLGEILPVTTSDNRICVNMFAQYGYETDKKYTNYIAFALCLSNLQRLANKLGPDTPIAFPYMIGCGLAGGDWNRILGQIEYFSKQIPNEVIIVRR